MSWAASSEPPFCRNTVMPAPEGVIADALREFGLSAAFLDDAQHIAPGNPVSAKPVVLVQRLKHGGVFSLIFAASR